MRRTSPIGRYGDDLSVETDRIEELGRRHVLASWLIRDEHERAIRFREHAERGRLWLLADPLDHRRQRGQLIARGGIGRRAQPADELHP